MNTHPVQPCPDGRFRFHPDRESAVKEAHARPSLNLEPNETVFHFALLCSSTDGQKILANFDGSASNAQLRYVSGQFGDHTVKIERHTEFVSCTIVAQSPTTTSDIWNVLDRIICGAETELLVAIKVEMATTAKTMLQRVAFGERMFGGTVSKGVEVRTTLIPDDEGVISLSLNVAKQSPVDLGRRVQRLLELETYRTLCLIGLPFARRSSAIIERIEADLSEITARVEQTNTGVTEETDKVFNKLVELSAQADALQSETRFRFAASHAYFELVQQRLASLKEVKSGDIQRLTSFIECRLEPAVATIDSVAKRQKVLSQDLTRALTLLRTQIDLNLNRANQASLRSLDKGHRQQLLISQTVEGLSVIAITYYAIGLLGYVYKAIQKTGNLPVSAEMATALSVPAVLLITIASMLKLRKKWHKN